MDEAQQPNLKRSENEEDEAIAHTLAAALCEDDVEKFLQLYDEIPSGVSLERLVNIKEMARQLAALAGSTRNHLSPIPVKESTYLGINHTHQATPLTLNSQLNMPDFSAFKTPLGHTPLSHTPVDQKHFDYNDDTLKKMKVPHNFSLSFYDKQFNDSGITHQEYLDNVDDDDVEQCLKHNEVEAIKTNDDDTPEYHTPPEFQIEDENVEGPPFGYPPKSDKLINSVIKLLSKTPSDDGSEVCEESSENCLKESANIPLNENELSKKQVHELFGACGVEQSKDQDDKNVEGSSERNELNSETGITVNLERDCSEKDSLDGSPHSRRSFTQQEEDDSGISIVDENDIVQESTIMTNGHHFETKKEYKYETKNEYKYETKNEFKFHAENEAHSGDNSTQNQKTNINVEKKTFNSEPELKYTKSNESDIKYSKLNETEIKYTKSNEFELKYAKSNLNEGEQDTSIGWQTRHKRMSKKRHDREFERMTHYNDTNSTESRSNHRESTPRRSASKNKDRNQGRIEKGDSYSKVAERNVEDRDKNAWTSRRGEESEIRESPKRSSRRGGQAGRKSDSKYTKNGNKEKHSDKDLGQHESSVQNTKPQLQPSLFSYRDALLLKAGSKVPHTKDQMQTPSKADRMFNLESAVNYLSTVWTSVNNLHRKDPAKVYIYNGE